VLAAGAAAGHGKRYRCGRRRGPQQLGQLVKAGRTHDAFDFAIAGQHDKGRNGRDAVLLPQLRLAVDIDFANRIALGRQPLDDRIHHAAGTTPIGVEVQQHGLL
jgi:hypothetical protein